MPVPQIIACKFYLWNILWNVRVRISGHTAPIYLVTVAMLSTEEALNTLSTFCELKLDKTRFCSWPLSPVCMDCCFFFFYFFLNINFLIWRIIAYNVVLVSAIHQHKLATALSLSLSLIYICVCVCVCVCINPLPVEPPHQPHPCHLSRLL